jgi:hypothetical protein
LALRGTAFRAVGGESPPCDTPKCHQKIDSETSGNNIRSARKNTAAVSARQTRSQITNCGARNGIFPPKSCVTERLHYFSEAIWGQIQIMSAQRPRSSEMEVAAIPIWLRILAAFLRAVFLGALVAITVRL